MIDKDNQDSEQCVNLSWIWMFNFIEKTINLLAILILYNVGTLGTRNILISKDQALIEIDTNKTIEVYNAITIATETVSNYWVRTKMTIDKCLLWISANANNINENVDNQANTIFFHF